MVTSLLYLALLCLFAHPFLADYSLHIILILNPVLIQTGLSQGQTSEKFQKANIKLHESVTFAFHH